MKRVHIAVDFGAGSGRIMAGCVKADGEVELTELHRFTNRRVELGGHVYWDFLALYAEMIEGLRKAVEQGYHILSIGIDTWGVDFGLIDRAGHLLSNPVCYRDPATEGLPAVLDAKVTPEKRFSMAGIQIMEINTVYRLMAMRDEQPQLLDTAAMMLFMPDLFSYFLTGNPNVEYTIATTSELIDARTRDWNFGLIDSLGLPRQLFGPIVMPGTMRGKVTAEVCRAIGADYEIPVVAVGSHDTQSAIFASAAPESPADTAYLSSGTWSLLGVLLDEPLLTDEARRLGFSNEGGIGGKICFLQNITGLWILQQLVEQWKRQGLTTDYPSLIDMAEKASGPDSIIDVDDRAFANPADMQQAIADYCRFHHLAVPSTQGETVWVVLRSLARRYKKGIDGINALIPTAITRLNIIGGGSLNALLNRLTSEAAGVEVIAGPVEATAIGNIKLQHQAL